MRVFTDSNIPMYVAGTDQPNRGPRSGSWNRCTWARWRRVRARRCSRRSLYPYHALGRPDLAARVYDLFVTLVSDVPPVTLADTGLARDLPAS